MSEPIDNRIQAASIPESLRTALADLARKVVSLLPALSDERRDHVAYLLNRVVEEGTIPSIDDHWWEVALERGKRYGTRSS
jgi:hypothetical protein